MVIFKSKFKIRLIFGNSGTLQTTGIIRNNIIHNDIVSTTLRYSQKSTNSPNLPTKTGKSLKFWARSKNKIFSKVPKNVYSFCCIRNNIIVSSTDTVFDTLHSDMQRAIYNISTVV